MTCTVIERLFSASLSEVWALWTTAEGIESWWGPEGFRVTVQALDLRPGGVLRYTMTATAAPQSRFMNRHGMPLSTASRVTYAEVVPRSRLRYLHLVDFVSGVPAYEVGTLLELEAFGEAVRMRLTLDPMHDEEWSRRAVMGWESEIGKLEALIAARSA
jgi:uncharacterized protein YndB with AHSA1/START domain